MSNSYRVWKNAIKLSLSMISVSCSPLPLTTQPVVLTATPTPTIPSATPSIAPSATRTPTLSAQPNEEHLTLRMGEWTALSSANDTRVILTTLLEDSRCPSDANCMQPGRARVAITIDSGGRLARFDLSSFGMDLNRFGSFNGYLLELRKVMPLAARVGTTIPPSDYRVTMRVTVSSLDAASAHFNEPFTLKLGQSVGFDGSTMRLLFESVQQDSRCPISALCATSGTATLGVVITNQATSETLTVQVGGNETITTMPAVRNVTARIRVNALTPYPQQEFASKEIAPNEYQATFVLINPAVPFSSPTPH